MPERTGGWLPNGLCSLFICDVASFGHPERSDLDRFAVRDALYEGLRRSFDRERIPFLSCYREDRGDGALLAVPPLADTTILLTTLIDRLAAEVRRHNHVSAVMAQLRLRVSVHTGVVHSDVEGLVGTAVNHAFRLLDAEQLKLALRTTGAELALIASQRVYDDLIHHGLGLVDPSEYQQVVVNVKETVTPAWIRVPGVRTPIPGIVPAPVTIIDAQVVPPELELTTPELAPTTPGPTTPELKLKSPDPPTLPGPVAVAHTAPNLDTVVDLALDIRQLRIRQLRDQIVAELPLSLTRAIRVRRAEGDRADMTAIIRTCSAHQNGLRELLRAVRQFVGNSAQVHELSRSIDALERA
jgi:Effector-associated domain 2